MKIRDHNQTMDVIDAEQMSVMEALAKSKDKSSDEYAGMVDNLAKLERVKKDEAEIKENAKSNLVPSFATTLAGTAVTAFGVAYMFGKENSGDTMLTSSTKGWMRALPKIKS